MTSLPLELPLHDAPSISDRASTLQSVPSAPQAPPRAKRRRAVWLAVHLNHWPLYAALASQSSAAGHLARPIAVVDCDRRASVLAVSDAAARCGVRPGHSLNAAIALCAHLQFLPRAAAREVQLLEALAERCEQFTGTVSLQPPNELLLEVRGSFALFGGVNALITRVHHLLTAENLVPRIALAPTAQGALWLARSAREARIVKPRELHNELTRLPVCVLGWPLDIEMRIARFGVLTVGDLLRLPRDGLARRLGRQYLHELDCAIGRCPDVRRSHVPRPDYVDRVLLDFEIETTSLLGALLDRCLGRLGAYLANHDLAVEQLLIELTHRARPPTNLIIGLASPTSDTVHLARLLHEHLTRLELPAPVRELVVRCGRLQPSRPLSRELFRSATAVTPTAASSQQARLLEHLRARLGAASIYELRTIADYRPECASAMRTASASGCKTPDIPPVSLPARPLWLLRAPQRLPRRTANAGATPSVGDAELIDSGWWDGIPASRAYYPSRSRSGALAWVFEDRAQDSARWLHGLFG